MAAPYDSSRAQMGATFYPGAIDDYQMPEVISPAPQRVMPEVPENMQDNLAHLELEASGSNRMANYSAGPQNQFPTRGSSMQTSPGNGNNGASFGSQYSQSNYGAPTLSSDYAERPNFSPFPALQNPPPNVPPSDDQREANLERGRVAVLASNDPEMQLAWAQDALSYVEVAMQNDLRNAVVQPRRPQTPQGEHQLKVDAINIVSFLAEQSHPRAEFIRGMWLEFGKFGFRIDKKEAFRCYQRAAEKGYARAEYRMGMQFENSNEPLRAIKHYEKGVSVGDSASYYRLGMMILLGQHGQRQDYSVGLDHIRYAAQTCDENAPQGAYVYGMLLARELPQVAVPEEYLSLDLNGARINIEKAAYHGFAKAQVKMGAAYELCQLGCDFDPALSLHYNALAARQGEPEAEMAISKWFLCGHEGVFEKNDEMAFLYAKRAAQNGLPTAEFALGYFYEIGIHVPVDIKEARTWYAKAAASGNKDATSRIDSISRSKTLSRKDHERVAIARIKSQYASHGRPQQQRYSSMQGERPIQETLEMPDPSKMSISGDPMDPRSSAAPYPEPNSRYGRPGAPGNQYGPDMRPTSAFGINPNIRTQSVQSAPSPAHRIPSMGPPQGYGPPHQNPGMAAPYQNNQPSPSPKLDIGFSAPPDPTGADRRRKLQRPTNASPAPPQSAPPHGRQGFPTDPRQPRAPSSPNLGGHPSQPTKQSTGHYPARGDSRPPQQSPVSNPPPSNPSKSPAQKPASGGLPGKGPKTFEEMGVPQGKTDSECVVMPKPHCIALWKSNQQQAIDVSANLHNKVTKSYAAKALKEMHEKKQVEGKISGKQIVYHTIQDPAEEATPEELTAIDREIEETKSYIASAKSQEKLLKTQLATLNARVSTAELRYQVLGLEKERAGVVARLDPLKASAKQARVVSAEEKAHVEKEWKTWQRNASTRRIICREMWMRCTEVLPEGVSNKAEFWESLGLEGSL
ncbi:hypothetical protein LOZ66_002315 [Ophidiomyces ophidiicola]|nr:hypothetical protein LOZ66_002315 [Ophidiomyces ophidiicola]